MAWHWRQRLDWVLFRICLLSLPFVWAFVGFMHMWALGLLWALYHFFGPLVSSLWCCVPFVESHFYTVFYTISWVYNERERGLWNESLCQFCTSKVNVTIWWQYSEIDHWTLRLIITFWLHMIVSDHSHIQWWNPIILTKYSNG